MLTLIVNFVLVVLTTLLLLVYFSTFKKTLPKKTFINLIALLVFDSLFTLSFILLVHLKVPLIVLQTNKLLIYVSMASFYYQFMMFLNKEQKAYKIALTVLLLVSSATIIFFGNTLGSIIVGSIYTFVIISWLPLLTLVKDLPSKNIHKLIYLLFFSGLLRYLVEGVITYELVFLTLENLWLSALSFIIKAISVLFFIEVTNLTAINPNLAKALDQQSATSLLNIVLKEHPNSILLTDLERKIVYVNDHLIKLSEYSEDELIGYNAVNFPSDLTPTSTYEEMRKGLSENASWTGEFINKKKSGDTFIEEVKIVTLKDVNNEPIYYLSLKTDITLEKQYLEKLIYLTRHDDLTNLYRRNYFIDLINKDVNNEKEQNRFFILFDINEFKGINDLYGHLTGDKALVYFANTLKNSFNKNTYLCRIGGDEFAAYVYDCDYECVNEMLNNFIKLLREKPFSDHNMIIDIKVSIGATKVIIPYLYNHIYDRADKYLYKAKNKGTSCVEKDF